MCYKQAFTYIRIPFIKQEKSTTDALKGNERSKEYFFLVIILQCTVIKAELVSKLELEKNVDKNSSFWTIPQHLFSVLLKKSRTAM